MFNPDFWKNLDNRLKVYNQMLEKKSKEERTSTKNQNKSEKQLYEDKLDRFIILKNFYDDFYFNIRR